MSVRWSETVGLRGLERTSVAIKNGGRVRVVKATSYRGVDFYLSSEVNLNHGEGRNGLIHLERDGRLEFEVLAQNGVQV